MRAFVAKNHLPAILQKIDKIPHINYGGCGVVAYHLADYLTKAGFKPKVIYMSHCHDYLGVHSLRNNEVDSCAHAYVQVGQYYYDSEGRWSISDVREEYNSYIFTELSLEQAKRCAYTADTWNDTFDRRRIRTIKRILS